MKVQTKEEHIDRPLAERILRITSLLSGGMLLCIMVLVTVSVIFRYLLNAPILGSQELIQLGMVFVIMLAMPYTAMKGLHIRVDILDNILGEKGRYACDFLARCLGIVVLLLMINKNTHKAFDAWKYEDVTNMIELPLWTAYAAITVGMGLYAAVLAQKLYFQIKNGAGNNE